MSCTLKDGSNGICMNPDDILAQLSGAEADNILIGKNTNLEQVKSLSVRMNTKLKTVEQILKSLQDLEKNIKIRLNIK